MKKLKQTLAAVTAAFILFIPAGASADSPYEGYIWNTNGAAPSVNGYLYEDSIDGYDMPSGPFNAPEDLFVAKDDGIYLVDGGNNRILHMDNSRQLIKVIGDAEGPGKLNGPKGVFVKPDGTIYVADTKNGRIVIFDAAGKFAKELKAPTSSLLGKDFKYTPSKLIVDKRDYLIVTNEGATDGLMQIDPNGNFKGFFGANHVGFSWKRVFVKLFASKEQQAQLSKAQPPEFSNLFPDSEGFIYTTTLGVAANQIKRLSAIGVDTLNSVEQKYGDKGPMFDNSLPSFVDVTVDDNGVMTAVDQSTGKLFQYDKLNDLLFVFGGLGEQDGLFKTPVAVGQTSDGRIWVADRARNRIDRFRTTPFADIVHQASALYTDGRYEEAQGPWNRVLALNGNYDIAYNAIGKALYKEEKYKDAMEYFLMGRSQSGYSQALREYRKEYMRNNFSYIVSALVLVYAMMKLAVWLIRLRKRRTASAVVDTSITRGGLPG